ncbi:putative Na+/H+ antiporter NhaD [Burkholderia plantarii]|uniref:Putative Na+/H+ antiporter NhaD n=1 Tax=Burkholderia plantarii TaxID=41899 RepID=A0A0B6RJK0_BURPL|nr:sodium:proton antiporter [Burkholderia plantarii]AJK45497.1 putative Na+/H+ antiporter NhaD [Burkholderia plantarii]
MTAIARRHAAFRFPLPDTFSAFLARLALVVSGGGALPFRLVAFIALALGIAPSAASAATLDGAALSALWGIPFAGMLLSIALFPLVAPAFWHHHFGKIAAGWACALLAPFAVVFGAATAGATLVHALLEEYVPFIVLLAALYTVAGGICLHGQLRASPARNTALLALGAVLASVMGTTGAAMLLIRPLLRANAARPRVVHVVVFFIFLVANAGGALSPLGDPPLFLGFLNGVDFFWTTRHLALPTLFVCAVLLAAFYLLDAWRFRRDGVLGRALDHDKDPLDHEADDARAVALGPNRPGAQQAAGARLWLDGRINFVLLVAIVVLVLMSGIWKPGIEFEVAGTQVALQNLVRDLALVVVALLSLAVTPRSAREGNAFDWAPIKEVAKLFAGIFVTIAPVIMILRAGADGAFAPIVHLVTGADGEPIVPMLFWATGLLSSFLDNAPTYLVFFNLAGGDAASLMTTGAAALAAISAGAVFMGANSYIGNAPNFMVKAIAEARGIRMPSFFGYLGWSFGILLPVFALATWLFFSA